MKIKQTTALLAALGLAVNVFGQGQCNFQNGAASAVIDSKTGAPAVASLYEAGLYFNVNLQAVPNLGIPDDGWVLAAVTPIIVSGLAGGGQYRGGTASLPGTSGGQEVLVQVRGWSAAFDNYRDAFQDPAQQAMIGGSAALKIKLGGGGVPIPTLSTSGITGFTLIPVPEPSAILLGLLGGLGAMVLLRRRQ